MWHVNYIGKSIRNRFIPNSLISFVEFARKSKSSYLVFLNKFVKNMQISGSTDTVSCLTLTTTNTCIKCKAGSEAE